MKKPNNKKQKYSLVNLLKEDVTDVVAAGPQEKTPVNNASLDLKFDHYLLQYERESIPTSKKFPANVTEKKSLKSIMSFLFEAPEDELPQEDDAGAPETPAPTDDLGGGGADLGMELPGGDETGGASDSEPTQLVSPPTINLNTFTRSMARLINNYEALLNPKAIMINRAKAYLEKNYDASVAKDFVSILQDEYDLSIQTDAEKSMDTQGPSAAWANAPLDTTAPSGGSSGIGGSGG